MTRHIRFVILLGMLLVAAGPTGAQQPAPAAVPGAQEALAPVKSRFAPDKRLAVFDVTVERVADGVVARGEVEEAEAREAAAAALQSAGLGPVTNQIAILPDSSIGPRHFGIVRVSVANVRGRASHPAEMVTQAVMGWTVRILKQQSGWYYVHTDPDGYLGWIEELQLTLVDDAGLRAWDTSSRVIVTSPFAIVMTRPSLQAAPVTDVVAGSLLQAEGHDGDWMLVKLADGRQGYLPTSQVAPLDAWKAGRRPTPDNVEGTAALFMGVPYLWGGTSSKGFDCSGYAKTVLRLNGIELPRDTDQQAAEGSAVTIDDQLGALRKGDLLFFGAKATADRPERISHVGIYVGGGEFLHASGLVRRNSLLATSPIYSESLRARLLRVRRVLPQDY